MSAVAAPIATIFRINDGFVLPALEGLTHDELWKAPTDRNNAMLWIGRSCRADASADPSTAG
jgi:hypothetical protein